MPGISSGVWMFCRPIEEDTRACAPADVLEEAYRYFRGSARRHSMELAATVAGLARKMRASREPMRPW